MHTSVCTKKRQRKHKETNDAIEVEPFALGVAVIASPFRIIPIFKGIYLLPPPSSSSDVSAILG